MIESRPFSFNPQTGAVTTFYYDHATNEITLQRSVEVDPILEANKAEQNDAPTDWKGDMHRVAFIPMEMFPQLAKLGITTSAGRILDKAKFKAWLNDPDNRAFRTKLGRV